MCVLFLLRVRKINKYLHYFGELFDSAFLMKTIRRQEEKKIPAETLFVC